MKMKIKDGCLNIQMPIYFDDFLSMLKDAKKEGLNLDQIMEQLEDYIKNQPESPYVRGSL